MAIYDNYENIDDEYIPDNIHIKHKPIEVNISPDNLIITRDCYNEIVQFSWRWGDTVSLPLPITRFISIYNKDIVSYISGDVPNECTVAELGSRFYNCRDVRSWKLINVDNDEYVWEEDEYLTYFTSGNRTVEVIPDISNSKIVANILNFRDEVLFSYEFEGNSSLLVIIDKETSYKMMPGVYKLRYNTESNEGTKNIVNNTILIYVEQ